MNSTVTDFYAKNASEAYGSTYDSQHGARLDAMVAHFNLSSLKGQKVLDVGGGLGFLGKRLDPSNDYWVIDGADSKPEQRVAKGHYIKADLDHDAFGSMPLWEQLNSTLGPDGQSNGGTFASCSPGQTFDTAFLCETIEHIGNPHHCLVELKKLVKVGGMVLISIPTITVWHNTPYTGLLWPTSHFEQFLGQMALPVVATWDYIPQPGQGWPAHHFLCANRPWSEKRLMFPKQEAKFQDCTVLEATNL